MTSTASRKHLSALSRWRPAIAEDVLVQVLSRAHAEEEAPGHERSSGRCSLRDDRRMDSDGGHVTPVPSLSSEVDAAIAPMTLQTNGL